MKPFIYFFLFVTALSISPAKADEYDLDDLVISPVNVTSYPYMPSKRNYSAEIGTMWQDQSLYWVGANVGFHVGNCLFSESPSCQQYGDVIAGSAGRTGVTIGVLMGGLRWQFVNYPSVYSPFARLLIGGMRSRSSQGDRGHVIYLVGLGLSSSVHRRMDLSIEARLGGGAEVWSQLLLGFNFKVEKWVEFFSRKIKELGSETQKAIKKTINAPKDIFEKMKIQK